MVRAQLTAADKGAVPMRNSECGIAGRAVHANELLPILYPQCGHCPQFMRHAQFMTDRSIHVTAHPNAPGAIHWRAMRGMTI